MAKAVTFRSIKVRTELHHDLKALALEYDIPYGVLIRILLDERSVFKVDNAVKRHHKAMKTK